ncbi:SoxR reducing system RseC family protein [uncultured Lutibacter sp.]|uniref:SoxR reducing system RseC family protein n=1 Tax=uncultured Lutibacter sp. TaxID=437739 RepID=UPI002624AEA3|nr:SoxR reducing system RseC family protein [uncultured Lutibacter sp.]
MEKLDLNSYKNQGQNTINHEGIISKISYGVLTVSLKGNINCEACNAKAACGVSESNSKEIEIETNNSSFQLNEQVEVILAKQLGLKAVFWAYVFPFVLVLVVLFVSSNFLKEWQAGLIALFVLAPYYFTLYVLKNLFKKTFKVSILKNNY